MKQRKNKRNLLIVCMLLLALCFVTGCGLFKSGEDKLKDLLEDKYGEKFGVESYYYAGDMWAMCYPLSDPTLLFEVRTDGEVTKISRDIYLQTVVARQVEEEYGPFVEQAFPGSYLSVTLSAADYEGQTADKVSLESMLQYNNSSLDDEDVGWTYIVFNIFINTTQLSEDSIEKEYAFFRDTIGNRVANDELPDTIVKLYFGDTQFVQECKQVIAEETWSGNAGIYEMTEGSPQIWIGYYENGEVDYTLDVYIEKRTEALNNE
ncbi:MAG: hypothetical protein J6B96_09130 [Agathobacter sp.]|nr:hypothetical protein [Agathobacter sp.]